MISFPRLDSWNGVSEVATIVAIEEKKRILCRIPLKILHDKYGATTDTPMQSVSRHREVIQEAAKNAIENNNYQQDGSVLLSLANL
ncbi:MAG: DUF1488 domain-containing protein [Gammaproteobacteria bacterium]|jgi:hypothetical protein|nr:DUF1488 domain-containing protein [Gammaproteobacteria bacterium]MBT5221252.1 DUF1488 domain-containing protein [Gammaproteobacteria bacterium]MBT5825348.1 DUF1488 domain-containing protein [Gammaproteobacteria bacterium]MBT5965946.1 DUF1488 domain-containing protein [Gammaproteobacteria bacterium]MBT6419134.1 DUF1488 domain-containing protein [Gammaproteobacteria bacterium]